MLISCEYKPCAALKTLVNGRQVICEYNLDRLKGLVSFLSFHMNPAYLVFKLNEEVQLTSGMLFAIASKLLSDNLPC